MYDAASPRLRTAIVLGARAGLRRSEALGLTVDRIGRDDCTITVDRQAAHRGAAQPFGFVPVKTPASHRVVPVAPATIDELPTEASGTLGLVLDVDGNGWADTVFASAWTRLARRVGVQFTFHDLRHFFCSTLLSQGITPKAVAKVAGHSSAVVTLSTYAHVMPDDDDRIRRALTQTVAPVIALGLAED